MTGETELGRSMDKLVGTWRTDGRIIDGGQHHGSTWTGFDIYDWFPGRQHMVHRVDVHLFGSRKEAIELFTPRHDDGNTFDQVSFDADGSVERGVGSFDDEGRYHNDLEAMRATVSFTGKTSMTALWEIRAPNGAWVDWMDVSFTRVAPPRIEIRSKEDHTE